MLWTLALLKLWSEAAALPAYPTYPARPGPLAVYAGAAPDVSHLLPHTRARLDRLLKDSYGNQFETAHTSPYKTMVTQFPKQFVRLQSLPAHLSSPLTLGASYRVHTPHFFVDSRYAQESSPQPATPTSVIVYGRQLQHHAEGYPTEDRLNRDAVVLKNNDSQDSRNEERFQRLEENPQVHHPRTNVDIHNSERQNAHVKASYPNNNENVHLSFDTKPVLHLLDLNLLKPLNFPRLKTDGKNIVKHSFTITRDMPTNVHQPKNHQVFETIVTHKESSNDGPVVMQIHEGPNYILYSSKHAPENSNKINKIKTYNNLVHHSYEMDTSKKPDEFNSLKSSAENSAYEQHNKQQTSRDRPNQLGEYERGYKNTQEVITPISMNEDTTLRHNLNNQIKHPVNDENFRHSHVEHASAELTSEEEDDEQDFEFSSLQSSKENSPYELQNKQQTSRDRPNELGEYVRENKNTQEVISMNEDSTLRKKLYNHIKHPVYDENRKDYKKNLKPFRQEDFNRPYNNMHPSIVQTEENIHPILRDNEHDVIISPTYKPHTSRTIVDPGTHLQFMENINPIQNSDGSQRTPPQSDHGVTNPHNIIPQNHRIVEKSKKIMMILSEKANDTPKERQSQVEHASAELMSEEEDDEQDFELSGLQNSAENSAYEHQNKQQTSRDHPNELGEYVRGNKNTQEVITPISMNEDTTLRHNLYNHIKHPVNDENRKDHKKNVQPFRQEDFNRPYNNVHPSIVKTEENIHPILRGNEHDVIISPTYKPHTSRIIVDPGAHLQFMANINAIQNSDGSQRTPPQSDHGVTSPHNIIPQNHRNVEKSKKVMMILSEKANDTPKEIHSHMEHASAELVDEEENDEQDFEKGYKQSAFDFPAFENNSEEVEKDIYNPNSYGNPRYSTEYDIVKSPYKENNQEIEDFNPSYKNLREMSKNNYISEYKIKRPEELSNLHKNQDDYSQIYELFRPANIKILNKKNTKNQKSNTVYNAENSRGPEMDYSQESDEGSIDSREKISGKTRFIEPKLQYGFQPIRLDGEIAAIATDLYPREEDPEFRKKITR